MLLSIIIPHYNLTQELLERCINSIKEQDIPAGNYEIIVVDDGSIAPPIWIHKQYPEHNIRLILEKHNGPGAARNRGLEEAQGEYIEFIDADDYLLPNGELLQCLEIIEKEHPQIIRFNYIVQHNNQAVKNNPKIVKFSNTISGAIYMRDNNLSGSPCTYIFSKELAQKKNITFPEGLFHEDEEFNTKLHYHAQTLIASNATPYCYCIRKGSTTANTSSEFEERRLDNIFTIIERIAHFRDTQAGKSGEIQRSAINHKLHTLVVDAILNMMHAGKSAKETYNACASRLSPLSLYPLPKAAYSLKYRIFRILTSSLTGMRITRIITPRKKPAKR